MSADILLVVCPIAQRSAVEAMAIPGGWGEPALSANGLCAWGVPATTLDDAALSALSAWIDLDVDPSKDDWKASCGWIDPESTL